MAVLNFLRYSTWPEPSANTLTVGVLGRRLFLQTLQSVMDGKPAKGHTIRVIEVKNSADVQSCQVIYFATERSSEIRPVLAGASARVLTIGEWDRFLDFGGAIHLFLVDGHIAFEADLEAIDRTGVTISSNLLRIGRIRDRRPGAHPHGAHE